MGVSSCEVVEEILTAGEEVIGDLIVLGELVSRQLLQSLSSVPGTSQTLGGALVRARNG